MHPVPSVNEANYVKYGDIHEWEGRKSGCEGVHPRVRYFDQGPGSPSAMNEWLTTLTWKIREVDSPRVCRIAVNSLSEKDILNLSRAKRSQLKQRVDRALTGLFMETLQEAIKEDPIARKWRQETYKGDLIGPILSSQASSSGTSIYEDTASILDTCLDARIKATPRPPTSSLNQVLSTVLSQLGLAS